MACAPGIARRDSGVAVGNPGNLRASIAPGEDVSFSAGRIYMEQLWLIECDGMEQQLVTELWLDLDAGDALELPNGSWCGLVAEWVSLEAVAESERSRVELALEVDVIELYGEPWNPADGDVLMRLAYPGWVSAEWLELDDRELSEELADIIIEASALVQDLNSNGQDDGEPELAIADEEAVDWEEPEEEAVEETEAGCHTAGAGAVPGSVGALGVLLGLLGLRRRQLDSPAA
jgi:hypothetical protein